MLGVIPAAGAGSRIQPLAFSKEMLPVGSRVDANGVERPKAVSEYLLERMLVAGADRVCFVIAPEKTDIMPYYAHHPACRRICYVVQESPAGLCDAIFRAAPLVAPGDEILVGLPDTVWSPLDGFTRLPAGELAFLLFPVSRPEWFDAVVTEGDAVIEIQVKSPAAATHWVWGAFRLPGAIFTRLHALWQAPGRGDQYVGTLVNAFLRAGGTARGIPAGERYCDIGTLEGYRAAVAMLGNPSPELAA
ncbi:MAG: sugar phosphate nucleotidyltransferase [Candidatus Binatia bacterium]